VPRKYFKKLKGTDDIWEIRVQQGNNIFRILGFFDGKNLVVLNHAFTKKSKKFRKKKLPYPKNENVAISNKRT
jgi:phage-related protein